jgi:hypothetical protein
MLVRRHTRGIAPLCHLSVGSEINFARTNSVAFMTPLFPAAFFITVQTYSLVACELLRFRSEVLPNADG